MCVLCGEFVMNVHWTDADRDSQEAGAMVTAGQDQRSRVRIRHHRVRLMNLILQHYGLQLRDWTGSKYLLSDRKGRTEVVQNLGDFWPTVQRLLGRPIDPLDPRLLEQLRTPQ